MTEEIALSNLNVSEYEKKPLKELTLKDKDKKLEVFGWVLSSRQVGKKGVFIDLYAHFKTIKCVYFPETETAQTISPWSSITVYGEVKENFTEDKFDFEFNVKKLKIHSIAPSFPINKDTQAFQKLELGHLYMRMPERMLFLRARSYLMQCFREFFFKEDCIEISPPTFVGTQVEGGSTLFKLDYFGKDAFLTQSSQLYLESVVPVCMKAFCMVNSYRAEKSHTTRHLTEYLHVEAELADIKFENLLCFIENMVHFVSTKFYEKFSEEIKEIYGEDFQFVKFDKPFKRLEYKDAIEFLKSTGYTKETGIPFELGDDIPDAAEVYICEKYGNNTPVFLTNFLTCHKPFYMKFSEDPKYTESVDLLWPYLGEVVGGSMRKESKEELVEALKAEGLNLEDYTFYLDLAEYGAHSKGGFGLGFERLLMGLMRYKNVNAACLYPRFVTRCNP
ncbi:asparagine-tRNA synthetase [Pseudoloma neurophilia]|uniref:asparagine--tRNA ligase n=1 Tax=Pseudoloma neurophilia TaxID=146866 RepID=A0A0R0M147_9MICR|nr:asparagine-tRNA synthetase [Pseudoloma neurophilia]